MDLRTDILKALRLRPLISAEVADAVHPRESLDIPRVRRELQEMRRDGLVEYRLPYWALVERPAATET